MFISEAEAKDLINRLDSPATRLPENLSESEFLSIMEAQMNFTCLAKSAPSPSQKIYYMYRFPALFYGYVCDNVIQNVDIYIESPDAFYWIDAKDVEAMLGNYT